MRKFVFKNPQSAVASLKKLGHAQTNSGYACKTSSSAVMCVTTIELSLTATGTIELPTQHMNIHALK